MRRGEHSHPLKPHSEVLWFLSAWQTGRVRTDRAANQLRRVDEALEVLRAHAGQMKDVAALEELLGYLEARRPYLPDYAARQRAGLWIASNRVEKFNDWGVSARCKHQGMEWTEAGVVSLAVLEAARRNGELPIWRAEHSLPAWKIPRGRKKVA